MHRKQSKAELARLHAQAKVTPAEQWKREANTWFTGDIESVDRRLANCNLLLTASREALARNIAQPQHVAAVIELTQQHGYLTDLRRQLLTAAADRDFTHADGEDNFPGKNSYESESNHEPVSRKAARWVALEGSAFARHHAGVDRDELLIRAANYAREATSTSSKSDSEAITRAFVAHVDSVAPKTVRTSATAHSVPNCVDEMLFM